MPTFVYRNGKVVDKRRAKPKFSANDATFVISDTMTPLQHMANGKMYDSKKAFRAATRAAGCVELGNETSAILTPRKPILMDRAKRRDDIRRTIYDLRNGRG
jgi:hypothetical protein